ncbi:hypothetical protein DMX04_15385 [Pseudomonas koreensis]|nr:hypothetical protein DMX04_15385 [Pseudomonas koreensis]
MVLAPRCLHKRSTAPPPFPLAPLFATLQTLIGTDQLVRRVSASPFGSQAPFLRRIDALPHSGASRERWPGLFIRTARTGTPGRQRPSTYRPLIALGMLHVHPHSSRTIPCHQCPRRQPHGADQRPVPRQP